MLNIREATDESLSTEREAADNVLRELKTAEQVADKVVDMARAEADAVLSDARHEADKGPTQPMDRAVVGKDRALADEALESERAVADDRIEHDRELSRHALAELCPRERERTNRSLLTERARSDEAIAHRDDFLAIVSHDLRDLLGAIVFSAAALARRAPQIEEREIVETGKRVQLYAARMNRLIGDLLDVASIEAGNVACTIVPGDPHELIAETLTTFKSAAAEKKITLESEVAGGLPAVAFDRDRILQVLANLVSNALNVTPPGGRIRVRGESTGGGMGFSVSDTGIGIPEMMLEAIFLRFWRAAGSGPKGTGLGLYISKSLVEAHGGRMWVASKVGAGSTFHFTIPAATVVAG